MRKMRIPHVEKHPILSPGIAAQPRAAATDLVRKEYALAEDSEVLVRQASERWDWVTARKPVQ